MPDLTALASSLGSSLGSWGWVIAGLILLALELFAPGAFMMWLGLAALAVGFIALAVSPAWQVSFLLFALFASLSVMIGRRIATRRAVAEDRLRLNERAEQLLGHVYVLSDAIEAGSGRIRVSDSSWGVEGPDLPAGAKVRVVGFDGARLKVIAA